MASGINLKKAQLAYDNVNKDIKNLETQLANFRKAVAEMNANIWYGGNSANKWYESANSAYKKDCKFLDSLYNIQVKLANKIDSTLAVSGSTEKTKKSGKGSRTGGGASVSGAASAAAAAETPADDNSSNPGGGKTDPPKDNGDNKNQEPIYKRGLSAQSWAKVREASKLYHEGKITIDEYKSRTISEGVAFTSDGQPVYNIGYHNIVPANYGKTKQDPTPTTPEPEVKDTSTGDSNRNGGGGHHNSEKKESLAKKIVRNTVENAAVRIVDAELTAAAYPITSKIPGASVALTSAKITANAYNTGNKIVKVANSLSKKKK